MGCSSVSGLRELAVLPATATTRKIDDFVQMAKAWSARAASSAA